MIVLGHLCRFRRRIPADVVSPVSAMSVMQEMDQRAGQQEEIRQNAQRVGCVLREQKEPGERQESDQRQPEGQSPARC